MADEAKRNCEAKHTKYQPTDEEFHCPKCGAKCGDFFKDDPVGEDDCDLLHDEDNLCCATCGYGCSGRAFAARIIKAKGLVQCPCCRGAGMVKKDINDPNLAVRLQALLEVWKKRVEPLRAGSKDFNLGDAEHASIMSTMGVLDDVIKQTEEILGGK